MATKTVTLTVDAFAELMPGGRRDELRANVQAIMDASQRLGLKCEGHVDPRTLELVIEVSGEEADVARLCPGADRMLPDSPRG